MDKTLLKSSEKETPQKGELKSKDIIEDFKKLKEKLPLFRKKKLNDAQKALQFSPNVKVITINVGGKLFTTTIGTLQSQPDSNISQWFAKDQTLPLDQNGNPFIDRDPDHFTYVLDYLRSGIYPDIMTNRLKKEFIFYGLPPEAPWRIDTSEGKLHHHLRVINDGSVVFKAPFETFSMCAGNKQFTEGFYQWRITLVNPSDSYFGVIDQSQRKPLETNAQNYSEFIGVSTEGRLFGMEQESDLGTFQVNDVIDFLYDADCQRLIIKITSGEVVKENAKYGLNANKNEGKPQESTQVIEVSISGKKIYPCFLIIDPRAKFKFENTGGN